MTVTDQSTDTLTDDEKTVLRQLVETLPKEAPEALAEPHGPVMADLRTSALETEVAFQHILKQKNKTAALRYRVLYLMWRELGDVRQVAALLPSTVTMHTVIAAVLQCASRKDFEQVSQLTD